MVASYSPQSLLIIEILNVKSGRLIIDDLRIGNIVQRERNVKLYYPKHLHSYSVKF